jgi:hypothetical protein
MSETETRHDPHARWKFLRDVIALQLKLMLGNVHNFVLIPVTLVAAAIDFVFGGKRQGERFYRVLEWGRRADEAIDLYSALGDAAGEERELKKDFTVDAVIARLEGVIAREYEKGGTAASVKNAVDKAIDQLQSETSARAAQVGGVATRLTEKLISPEQDS